MARLGRLPEHQQIVRDKEIKELSIVRRVLEYELRCAGFDRGGDEGRDEHEEEQADPPFHQDRDRDETGDREDLDPGLEVMRRLVVPGQPVDQANRCGVVDPSCNLACLPKSEELIVRHWLRFSLPLYGKTD